MKTDIKDMAVETRKGPGRVRKVDGSRALVRFSTGEEEWHDASDWYLCDTPFYVDGTLLFDTVQTFKDYVFEAFGETVILFRVDSAYRNEKGCTALEDLQ